MTPDARCALPDYAPLFAAPEAGARDVCLTCPLVIQCATGALARGERWGVWGGLDLSPSRPGAHPRTALGTPIGRPRRPDVAHGTPTAWRRHERAREALCDPCRDARAAHSKARWQASKTA